MPRIASQGELVGHTTTSGDGGALTTTAGSEVERIAATPAHAYTPDIQQDDFQSIAERCAAYLHHTILRGDPFDERVLAGWPAIMEFLLRETGFPEDYDAHGEFRISSQDFRYFFRNDCDFRCS